MRVCAIAVVLMAGNALAADVTVYRYQDAQGKSLLTNVAPSGQTAHFTQQVSVHYYPDTKLHGSAPLPATYNPAGASAPSKSANKNAFDAHIVASARRHGVDPALIKAVMHTESSFNPRARSPVGALGLMQLMPATARRFGVTNAYDPAQNIEGAAKYLSWLNKRWGGRLDYVLASYNAGEGNVKKYGGIPPFKETQNYVKSVTGRYHTLYKQDPAMRL